MSVVTSVLVAACVLVVGFSAFKVYGGSITFANAERGQKLKVLGNHLDENVIVVAPRGAGRAQYAVGVAGRLTSVDKRGVGIQDGTKPERFIPLDGVWELQRADGSTVADWT